MDRGMEWLIGGILALIIAIVGFYYTKKVTALIVPILFIFYGVYRVLLGKKIIFPVDFARILYKI
jgi:hypothetical protein